MGLFSSKKTIVVDSVTYNLSGDYKDRMNYLPTVTIGNALGGDSNSFIGEANTNSLINGPYSNQISLLRWSRNHYSEAIPLAVLAGSNTVDSPNITTYLKNKYKQNVVVKRSVAAITDITYWAKKYVLEKYGEISSNDWVCDIYESTTTKITKIALLYKDSTKIINLDDCFKNSSYLYTEYYTTIEKNINKTDDKGNNLLDDLGNPIIETVQISDKLHLDIYRFGSGNFLLDPIKPINKENTKSFMPFMPIRIKNKFISEMPHYLYYDKVNKFYKKATGKKLDDFIKQLGENEKIDDIDYAYVVFGVALNTKRPSCKEYLFAFFRYLHTLDGNSQQAFSEWKAKIDKNNNAIKHLYEDDKKDKIITSDQIFADIAMQDDIGVQSDPPSNSIDLSTYWLNEAFRLTLSWSGISTNILTGKDNPNRKIGEVWLNNFSSNASFGNTQNIVIKHLVDGEDSGDGENVSRKKVIEKEVLDIPSFSIYKQIDASHAIVYDVLGLVQQNHVYKDKNVETTSLDALADKDEGNLIIPIHLDVMKKLSLKHRCQVCTEDMYVIFNCYVVKKTKWYQTGIFKVLVGIVLAIASVVFAPAGALGAGILGSNLAIGTALGIGSTVLAAAIVGAVVNAIAAIIITTILTKIVGTLFKGMFGAIFGAIFGLLLGNIGSLFNGTNITAMLGQVFSPRNILNLTQAVIKSVNGVMQSNLQNMQQKMQQMTDEYSSKNDELDQKMSALKGTNGVINSSALSRSSSDVVILNESMDTFLTRTKLTLCDIAELDKAHITSTIDTAKELPQAFA